MLQGTFAPFGASDPFQDMRRMQAEMNRMFDGAGTVRQPRGFPAVNFWGSDDSIVLTAELPGLTHDDVELTVKDQFITIRGEFPEPRTEDTTWHRHERPTGKFARVINLPFRIDPNKVEARFANGVLQIEMQRPDEDKPKRIEIKSS